MSKEIISDGNDFIVEYVDRAFGGSRSEAINISGATGLITLGNLLMNSSKVLSFGEPEELTGDLVTCDPNKLITLWTSDGNNQAISLPDGSQAGQLKIVVYVAEGGAGDEGQLTPDTPTGFSTVDLAAAYDAVVLMWTGSAWAPILATGTAVINA